MTEEKEKTIHEKLQEIKQIVPSSKSLLSNESYRWYPAKEVDRLIQEREKNIVETISLLSSEGVISHSVAVKIEQYLNVKY